MSEIDFFGMENEQNNGPKEGNELVVEHKFDYENLLNDGNSHNVKLCVSVKPSDEIRRQFEAGKYQSTHICLVIDTSESMYRIVDDTGFVRTGETRIGEDGQTIYIGTGGICKKDIAMASAKKVADLLRPGDTVDCITYDDEANVVFKALGIDEKEKIQEYLSGIKGMGDNTNISAALNMAGDMLDQYQDASPKVILFFTDGEPTGEDNEELNIEAGNTLAGKSIVVNSMGFGQESVNFENLQAISTPTGGITSMINYPDEFSNVFRSLFAKAQSTVITNVKLKMFLKAGSVVGDYYRGTPDNSYLGKCDSNELLLNIGQIEKNQSYKYYFDMTVPGQQSDYEGLINTASISVSYQVPSKYGNDECQIKEDIPVNFTSDMLMAKQIDGNVNSLFREAEVKKFDEERKKAYNEGDKENAIKWIKKIIQVYTELQNPAFAKAYEDMLKEYMETNSISKVVLNKATSSSSQARDSGILEDLEEEEFSRFSERLKRRRKG